MPAVLIETYHAHTQFNNHSGPNQPRKQEHDPTYLDQQRHAEADCALALTASLLQKYQGAKTKQMPAVLIALLLIIAATKIDWHIRRRDKCLSADPTVVEVNYSAIYLTFCRRFCLLTSFRLRTLYCGLIRACIAYLYGRITLDMLYFLRQHFL